MAAGRRGIAKEAKEDRVLRQAQALLTIDPQTADGARRLGKKRGEVLALLDLLAAQDHVEEACELGLLLEQAMERLGEPTGLPAAPPAQDGSLRDAAPAARDGVADRPGAGGSRYQLIEHLLGIARAAAHPFYEGEMLLREAELWADRDAHEHAQSIYAQVQALAQGADLGLLEVAALAGLAGLAQKEGNLFKAHGLYAKQRAQAQALGEVIFESQALANLAATALAMGDFRRGARYARERIQLSEELGDERGRAEALGSLGLALRNLGDLEGGRRAYLEALRLCRRLGIDALEAAVCYNLGCLLGEGEPEAAAALLEHAGKLAKRAGARPLADSCAQAATTLAGKAPDDALAAARRQAAQRVKSLVE